MHFEWSCEQRGRNHTESFGGRSSRGFSKYPDTNGPKGSKTAERSTYNDYTNLKHGQTSSSVNHKVYNKLMCMYTNADGLNAVKGSKLSILIEQCDPDIVLITETKLGPDGVLAQFVDCSNYDVFRKDRMTCEGGGVLIMVRRTIPVTQLFDGPWSSVEAVVCELRMGSKLVHLACMYRPPRSTFDYNEMVCRSVETISSHWRIQRPVLGGQKFWRVIPNLPPFSTFFSDFGHFIFKTQNFNNFYFMFNFYINFCQIPQALRAELADLAEGPSLAIKRPSLTSRRLLTRALEVGGGGKKCHPLRFFANSGKTAARSAAIFSVPA